MSVKQEEDKTELVSFTRKEFLILLNSNQSGDKGLQVPYCNFQNLDFRSLNLEKVNFRGCNLSNCNFEQAILTSANFDEAKCCGANFKQAILKKVCIHKICNFFYL